MDSQWFTVISKELEEVEALIGSIVHSNNDELNDMCRYVITSGGKRIRPAMCILSYFACGGKDPKKAIEVGSAFEIVHNASLIHDDINDKSEIRRGRRTLHKEYCVSKAIVAGDFMMAKGFQAIGSASNDVVDVIVEAASSMSEGEFVQKDFEHASIVTEKDYFEIIHGKTAMLINASAKSGAFLAKANIDLTNAISEYATNIGIAFQVIDDVLDVVGDSKSTGKRVGIDLIEGKPTLPTIYAMRDVIHGPKICEVFSRIDVTDEDVAEALELIKKTDSIEKCRLKAEKAADKAIESIGNIPDSEYKDAFISLARYIVSRDR
ncbi:MAG: polyprenyl synthetase family protein [Candidatus Methanomethylophilaceae archaeon]|jgi:octaprenyl-diphosphate synthase